MANFNKTKEITTQTTVNHEGMTAFQLGALETLFSKSLGSFFGEKTAYENRDAETAYKELEALIDAVPLKDSECVLKIAELARLSNMIDYPLQVLSVAFHNEKFKGENFLDETGKSKMNYYADVIVRRAKDVNQLLASHFAMYEGTPIPSQMKKQLRSQVEQFDKYKLSKGLDTTKSVSLADTIKLVRPRPANDEMAKFYKDIIEDTVTLGNTQVEIQSALSNSGKVDSESSIAELEASVHTSNVQALLRNLTALYRKGVFNNPKMVEAVVRKLNNKKAVLSSKLLPYRFYSAYKMLSANSGPQVQTILEAIEVASDYALDNVEDLEGYSAYLVDRSGSMRESVLSAKSAITADELAAVLGAIAYKKGKGDLYLFATTVQQIKPSRKDSIISLTNQILSIRCGGGTDIAKAIDTIAVTAIEEKLTYDNLIVLTDGDCYGYNKGIFSIGEGRSWGRNNYKNADDHINELLSKGIIKKVWFNDLLGNTFSIVNTRSNSKNLIVGFSEKYLNILHTYNLLGSKQDVRTMIDQLLEAERQKAANVGNM